MMVEEPYQEQLLCLALESIRYGLEAEEPVPVSLSDWPEALCAPRATFVTLLRLKQLRGCVGTLEAQRPLPEDVAHNAYAAAFQDPRFPRVTHDEVPGLDIRISILSIPERMDVADEADVLRQLRPGIDGVILEEGRRRATFLPSVWEELSSPPDFLRHLKLKAGWRPDYWSDRIAAYRYTVDYLSSR